MNRFLSSIRKNIARVLRNKYLNHSFDEETENRHDDRHGDPRTLERVLVTLEVLSRVPLDTVRDPHTRFDRSNDSDDGRLLLLQGIEGILVAAEGTEQPGCKSIAVFRPVVVAVLADDPERFYPRFSPDSLLVFVFYDQFYVLVPPAPSLPRFEMESDSNSQPETISGDKHAAEDREAGSLPKTESHVSGCANST